MLFKEVMDSPTTIQWHKSSWQTGV